MAYSNNSWSTWNSWDSSAHPSQQGNWWSSTDWQQGSWSDQSWQQNTTAPQTPYKKRKLDEAGTAIPTHQSHQDSSTSAHTLPTTLSDVSFSPSGKQSGAPLDTPTSWKAAEGFHDVNYIARRQMPSTILPTPWSRKNQLAGIDPLDVPLHKVCYKAKENISLRWLAHGEFVSVVFCRNIKETVFIEKLLQNLRALNLDLDVVATQAYMHEFNKSPDMSTPEKKAAVQAYLAQKMVQPITQMLSPGLCQAAERVKTLEKQIINQGIVPLSANAEQGPPTPGEASAQPTSSSADPFKDALQPDFEPTSRPLKNNGPTTHTPAAVNKWIKNLDLSDMQRKALEAASKRITSRNLDTDIKENLQNKAAEFGLSVSLLQNMKDPQLLQVILAAVSTTI